MGSKTPRKIGDLTDLEREQLEAAHRELRTAVAAYDEHRGAALGVQDPSRLDRSAASVAQRRVQEAESKLWSLRERLLGWERPAGTPPASQLVDWFSEEDAVYDELGDE